jgi:hypothetical protein
MLLYRREYLHEELKQLSFDFCARYLILSSLDSIIKHFILGFVSFKMAVHLSAKPYDSTFRGLPAALSAHAPNLKVLCT